ncbi:MAG: prefoldin subunit alpha [Methanobacteriota archaeon]|nr:MAG: prefoldin subunit alpha [Euryarchaeota archaeon]
MNEDETREAVAMLETAKAQLEALMRQQEILRLTLDEHKRAKETMERFASGTPGEDILVPIGADSMVHATISENRNAVISIGAGVSFERPSEEAGKMIDLRIDDLNRALQRVVERVEQTELSMQQLSDEIQKAYSQTGAPKA